MLRSLYLPDLNHCVHGEIDILNSEKEPSV
jgi:hypothetical protein